MMSHWPTGAVLPKTKLPKTKLLVNIDIITWFVQTLYSIIVPHHIKILESKKPPLINKTRLRS
jgi:hypothetical protein